MNVFNIIVFPPKKIEDVTVVNEAEPNTFKLPVTTIEPDTIWSALNVLAEFVLAYDAVAAFKAEILTPALCVNALVPATLAVNASNEFISN